MNKDKKEVYCLRSLSCRLSFSTKPVCCFIILVSMGFFFTGCYGKPIKHHHRPVLYFSGEMRPLGDAIYDDKADEVRRLMTLHKLGPDALSQKGYSLLIYSTLTSSKSVFKMLLEMGADPNKRCEVNIADPEHEPYMSPGWALECAMYQRDPDYVNLLLKYGANVNIGYPLHAIVSNIRSEKEALKQLNRFLNLGSDINAYDEIRETPLINAINCGRLDCANLLIDRGADITLPDGHGNVVAYKIQRKIDRCNTDYEREVFLRHAGSTIERLKARGVTFPVPKPVIEGETYWQRYKREQAEQQLADTSGRDTTNQPNRWTILDSNLPPPAPS